jgi:hypothetical protein
MEPNVISNRRVAARRVDRVLCAVWALMLALGLVFGWPVGAVAFCAFAMGERWGVSWYR